MENGGYDVTLKAGEVRDFEPVYGEKALNLLYIAVLVALIALLVLPIVKMGKFGVVSGYATLSYLIVVGLCYAFITGAAFEITLGSILVFLAFLVVINLLQYRTYNAIKAEFDLGKTVDSSVKGGYKKTILGVVDVYAVALLGALAMLIGAASLYALALQTIICVIAAAFMNLLWARVINFTFLSASKNKYKYFRFVREDDDDE
jgi:preprotein translocase subunit SecD